MKRSEQFAAWLPVSFAHSEYVLQASGETNHVSQGFAMKKTRHTTHCLAPVSKVFT